jgi:hypothetical protein
MKRRLLIAASLALSLFTGCASDGTGGNVEFYGGVGYSYGDYWYGGGGCCIDYPGDIGPPNPHPEHPIALPPGADNPRPEQPIATPPKAEPKASNFSSSRSMPSPRPAMRGGGGRR